MDRKKTILIAVLINAGLLAVLFVAALTTQEEVVPSMEMSQASSLGSPLFPDSADSAHQQQTAPTNTIAAPPPIQLPIAETAPPQLETQEPMVHKLPPLVPEAMTPTPVTTTSSFLEVIVKKGDSLDKIAKAHHTTVDEIIKTNQLPSSFLKVGQVLKLPTIKTAAPVAKKAGPEKVTAGGPEYYTIKVGDNPWSIAMKHHLKVEELLKLNQLNEEKARKLKPGDRLRIR
jgi:LysM repeat protein